MLKAFILSLISIFSIAIYSQINVSNKYYRIQAKALNIGIYNPQKVIKNTFKVFHDIEADSEFEKVLQKDRELKKIFVQESLDDEENIIPIREEDIHAFYPDLGIIIKGGGHGFISVFDIKNKKELCGDPQTYAYSPSRRYRLCSLNADGMHYYLEEQKEKKYTCIGEVRFEGDITGYYWNDEKTIYYLRERNKEDGSKYWIAYAGSLIPTD